MRKAKRFFGFAACATVASLTGRSTQVLAGPVPLLSYNFDEGTGVTAPNAGTALSYNNTGGLISTSPPAQMFTSGTATDLHGAAGSGVSGAANDYALNLSAIGGMGSTFNGSSMARVTRPAIQSLASFTLSGWLKPDEIIGSNARIFSYSDGSGTVAINLSATANGVLGFNVDSASTASTAVYNSVGQWMYFAVTYDGTKTTNNVTFYEGSAPGGTVSSVGTNTANFGTVAALTTDPAFLYIGNGASATRQFDGLMDDIQVYGSASDNSGALSANAIKLLYASTSTGTSTWSTAGSGDWNTAANWFSTVPNAVDAKAAFTSGITTNNVVYTTSPITVGTLTFNNSAAAYAITGSVGSSLNLQVSSGSALVDVQAGTHELNLPVTLTSNTTFQTDSATAQLVVSDPLTIKSGIALNTTGSGTVVYQSTITLQSGATMNLATSSYAHALALAASSTATLTATVPGAKTLLQLDSLTNAGTLNVNNNDLVVHSSSSLASVTASLASGFSNGNWNGSGISSTNASSDPTHLHALGIAPAATSGTFDGASVAAGDVLVKYTYYGDTNLDGKVDGTDYSRIDSAYVLDATNSTAAVGWYNGDFNFDGTINGSDYTLIDNAFNTQGSQIAAEFASATAEISGSSAVPEPGTFGLLAAVGMSLLNRRRRN